MKIILKVETTLKNEYGNKRSGQHHEMKEILKNKGGLKTQNYFKKKNKKMKTTTKNEGNLEK